MSPGVALLNARDLMQSAEAACVYKKQFAEKLSPPASAAQSLSKQFA
jgi:BarA-like signal transduction histidine kinase